MGKIILDCGTTFNVHIQTLSDQSSYFRAAFNGGFAETKSRTVTMAGYEKEVMGHLLQWFYAKDLREEAEKPTIKRKVNRIDWTVLVKTWLLADYVKVDRLQRHITEIIDEQLHHWHLGIIEFLKDDDLGVKVMPSLPKGFVDALKFI